MTNAFLLFPHENRHWISALALATAMPAWVTAFHMDASGRGAQAFSSPCCFCDAAIAPTQPALAPSGGPVGLSACRKILQVRAVQLHLPWRTLQRHQSPLITGGNGLATGQGLKGGD
jgi:hypothetical protein